MSQPNDPTTSLCCDGEYEFPDELEGIDWSVVGPIEGDEPKPEEQTQSSAPDDPSLPTDLPSRPASRSSSYGFADIETLDEDDLAELDETERLYGLTTEEILENTPSSSARTLDDIPRPVARLPTADDIILSPSRSSGSRKRRLSDEDILPLTKSRTLPLECTQASTKGKGRAQDTPLGDVIQSVYTSFVESCSCPVCYDLFAIPYNIIPCGHTVCGACLCDWIDQSRYDASCPMCRQPLNCKTSLSRNYTIESIMDQQARILAVHGYPGWEHLGADVLSWTERKASFQREASARLTRITVKLGSTPSAPPAPRPNNRRRRNRNRTRDRDQVIEIRPFEVVRTRP